MFTFMHASLHSQSHIYTFVLQVGGGTKGARPRVEDHHPPQQCLVDSLFISRPCDFHQGCSSPLQHRVNARPLKRPIADARQHTRWVGLCPEKCGPSPTEALGRVLGVGLTSETATNPLARCNGPKRTPPCLRATCMRCVCAHVSHGALSLGPCTGIANETSCTSPASRKVFRTVQ